jgi:hypothetical protein
MAGRPPCVLYTTYPKKQVFLELLSLFSNPPSSFSPFSPALAGEKGARGVSSYLQFSIFV